MKHMRNVLLNFLGVVLCMALHDVQAMTVETHGNQVFASGPVEDDVRKFEEALIKSGVYTVVFVNSPGADLWTSLRVGRLTAEDGLKTVIAGGVFQRAQPCSWVAKSGGLESWKAAGLPVAPNVLRAVVN